MATKSTTIRISEETKEKMENLDFVRKHTFDEIIFELIKSYEKRGKVK
jgi:predicted DNA-binding protein